MALFPRAHDARAASAVGVLSGLAGCLLLVILRHRCRRKSPPRAFSVVSTRSRSRENSISVVLVHGMWHGAWFYEPLQKKLAAMGIESHAIQLQERANRCGNELVDDLEATIKSLRLQLYSKVVLVGHSQGGVLVQHFLERLNRQGSEKNTLTDIVVGAVMLGTFPLGLLPPLSLLSPSRWSNNMYFGPRGLGLFTGLPYFLLTGKLLSSKRGGNIFLNPTTETTPFGSREDYEKMVYSAKPDGWLTMTQFIPPRVPRFPASVKVLVLGAENDIIYPPELMEKHFRLRFPCAKFHVARGQGHCFCDTGWETEMAEPLMEWLNITFAHVQA